MFTTKRTSLEFGEMKRALKRRRKKMRSACKKPMPREEYRFYEALNLLLFLNKILPKRMNPAKNDMGIRGTARGEGWRGKTTQIGTFALLKKML